jgi:hypothetical protein
LTLILPGGSREKSYPWYQKLRLRSFYGPLKGCFTRRSKLGFFSAKLHLKDGGERSEPPCCVFAKRPCPQGNPFKRETAKTQDAKHAEFHRNSGCERALRVTERALSAAERRFSSLNFWVCKSKGYVANFRLLRFSSLNFWVCKSKGYVANFRLLR